MTPKLSLALSPCSPDVSKPPSTWLPSAEALVTALRETCAAGEPSGLVAALSSMGTPAIDLTVTPLSARVGLLAAQQGQAFFHHELRGRVPVPKPLFPEREVWSSQSTLPEWEEGVLVEPKYFSFFLDAPLVPLNPNYRRKWRAHELLHGLSGFFWHPQMTRFEAYLGARLDELLPIVHWYGLDEVLRPRCPLHKGQRLFREFCVDCEAMAQHYWTLDEESIDNMSALASSWIQQAWSHFDEEWAACHRERESGLRCETPRAGLNASSDAVGYLYGHWPRLTAWSFGAWTEHFLVAGHDFYQTIEAYMRSIANTAGRMVSGDLDIPISTSTRAAKARRLLQDIGYRTFVLLEHFEDGSRQAERAEDALMPLLESGGELSQRLLTQDVDASEVGTWITALHSIVASEICADPLLPASIKTQFPALGILWPDSESTIGLAQDVLLEASLDLVEEGLRSTAPQALAPIKSFDLQKGLRDFVQSQSFLKPGRLGQRFADWLVDERLPAARTKGSCSFITARLYMDVLFEVWTDNEPRRDADAEDFGVLPDDVMALHEEQGTLRLHKTFRREEFLPSVVEAAMGETVEAQTCILAAIRHNGNVRLMPIDPVAAQIIDAVAQELSVGTWLTAELAPTLELLLEHAFVVWLPKPRVV